MSLDLRSERLVLRPFEAQDLDIAVANFTNPEVMKFTGGAMAEADIRAEMPNWLVRGGVGNCLGVWCVCSADTNEKLGSGALLPIPIEEKDTDWSLLVPGRMPDADIEIGYYLKPSAWGQGYATEVSRRLVRFAFEETPLDQVVATHTIGNDASRKVLLKTGFADLGTRRAYGDDNAPFLRITREEWRT